MKRGGSAPPGGVSLHHFSTVPQCARLLCFPTCRGETIGNTDGQMTPFIALVLCRALVMHRGAAVDFGDGMQGRVGGA